MIEWTGERFLTWIDGAGIHCEHLHRYAFVVHLVEGKIENVINGVIKTYEDIIATYRRERSVDLDYVDSAPIMPERYVGIGGHRKIFHPLKPVHVHGPKTLAKRATDNQP
jgi:hypothetical protein